MSRQQVNQVIPPENEDEELKDFSAVIQRALDDLYEESHRHEIRTTVPTDEEGQVTDIYLVDINGTTSLYAKFPSPLNWRSVTLT